MSFDQEKILQDYIARLLALQDERDEWLDEDDLQKAARDLGLSDRDLARVEALTAAHRQRGLNFRRHEAWDEAIAEFRQAMVLAPFEVPLVYDLAAAHASRWQDARDGDDRRAAERYARRCIQLDPGYAPAYDLLTTLKPAPAVARSRRARTAVFLTLLGGAVVAALALILLLVLNSPQRVTTPPPPPDGPLPGEMDLPVHLAESADAAGLRLEVQRSQWKNFDSTFSYTLHAVLHNQDRELHRLRMKIELIDPSGATLHTRHFDVLSDHQPYLRPGDTAPVSELVYERTPPTLLGEVRLTVDTVEREAAAEQYGAPRAVPLAWDAAQPAYLDVAVYERESRLTDGFRQRMHFLTLAVHNRGTRAVQRLRLRVTWYDAQDRALTSELTYVVLSSGPALRAGETWLTRVIGKFPEGTGAPFARYAVSVAEGG